MKKLIALLCISLFTLAACGDSGSAGSCEDVADEAAKLIEDVFSDLSIEDLLAGGDELPPAVANLESDVADLEEQAEELGCSDEEMSRLMDDRLENLDLPAGIADLLSE